MRDWGHRQRRREETGTGTEIRPPPQLLRPEGWGRPRRSFGARTWRERREAPGRCGMGMREERAGGIGRRGRGSGTGVRQERAGSGGSQRAMPGTGRGCRRSRSGDAAAAAGARGKPCGGCGGYRAGGGGQTGLGDAVGTGGGGAPGTRGHRDSVPAWCWGFLSPSRAWGVPGSAWPSGDRGSPSLAQHVLIGVPSQCPPPAVRLQLPRRPIFPMPTMGWQRWGQGLGLRVPCRAVLCQAAAAYVPAAWTCDLHWAGAQSQREMGREKWKQKRGGTQGQGKGTALSPRITSAISGPTFGVSQ